MGRRVRPRGFNFYLKWSMGNWAEEIVYSFCQTVLARELGVYAYRYGYSAGRIPEGPSELEEILQERSELERYGKRPNFLLFSQQFAKQRDQELSRLMRRPDEEVGDLVKEAVLALEVEHSIWSVKRATVRLSFTVKKEDVLPLNKWLQKFGVPIVVLQVFMDELHALPLEEIVGKGKLRRDPTTKKLTYFLQVSPRTRLADIENVYFDVKVEFDEKGKLIPFVMLRGGNLTNVDIEAIRRLATALKGA